MPTELIHQHTAIVKDAARRLGFDYCGITSTAALEEEKTRFKKWLQHKHHGEMSYLENHFEKRLNPAILVEGARSVVSLMYNYYPARKLPDKNNYKISKYAYGADYHYVIRRKLKEYLSILNDKIGKIEGRGFVDSAPVMERQLAARSGLGWIGKNTLLINKKKGSFFFLAELIIDLELIYDGPTGDFCGTCTRCIDACPTDALSPYQMDAKKCISYLTIELKKDIPADFKGKMNGWIFGCDICQDVCPWNRFSKPHKEPAFDAKDELVRLKKPDWETLTENAFNRIFQKSAVKRTRYSGLKRNISFVSEKN